MGVPEREQAIATYRRIMREKMIALKVPEKDVNASFPADVNPQAFQSCSDAVRDALQNYHKHSEALGIFMPFPGDGQSDGYNELEPEANKKLMEYAKKLNEDDPNRLWGHIEPVETKSGRQSMISLHSEADHHDHEAEDGHGPRVSVHSHRRGFLGRLSRRGSSEAAGEDEKKAPGRSRSMLGGIFSRSSKPSKPVEHVDTVEIVFIDENKEDKAITFDHQPLGMEFFTKAPLMIKELKPGSYAEEMGVQKGWKIKSVAGTDITRMWYKSASSTLYNALEGLDKREAEPT